MTKTEFQTAEAKINTLLRDITMAFGVSAGFFDLTGRQLGCCGFESRSNFCRFIHFYDTKQICRQSYLQGFSQSASDNKPLVYFCPFGLLNITFPILQPGAEPYFVTAGPLLYRMPDDRMITNILSLNYLLKPRAREIRQNLSEITVKSEAQVHSIVTIIENALKGTTLLLTEGEETPVTEKIEVSDSLQLWLRGNPYAGDTKAFQKVIDTISFSGEGELTEEELKNVVTMMTDFIFKSNNMPIMVHRSLKYVEFLMEITKKSNMQLEHIFNSNAINIEKIIEAKTPNQLENLVMQNNTIFMNNYLARKEVHSKDVIFRSMHYMRSHFSDISLSDVAEAVNLNPAYFSNLFKRSTGQSYSLYLNKIRIEESKKLLLANDSLSEIAQKVGFSDQSYFTNVFKKIEGISPNRWKNAQRKKEVPL